MGGSGGGGYFPSDRSGSDLGKSVRRAEKSTQNADYNIDVNRYLSELLGSFNERDTDTHSELISQIESDLQNELDISVSLLFGGSVAKRTYVDGLSDVDMLACVHRDIADGNTPSELISAFADTLRARYGKNAVEIGNLSVTLKIGDVELQVLPAFRKGDDYFISTANGEAWANIKPRKFADRLTKTNQDNGSKIVPIIKLAKALMAEFPSQRQLTGYHVESLAIAAFRGYEGTHNIKEMLTHFFEKSSQLVLKPIKDSTGQSVNVDGYLDDSHSIPRRIRSDALSRVARRILNADGASSMDAWYRLFGES